MSLLKKFEQYWKAQNFPPKNQKILMATSGGKDSMALAHILLQLGYPIQLAHCNFQLRGADSLADEQLVNDWANAHQIPLFSIRWDTHKEMEHRQLNVQECARALRYEWFQKLCTQEQIPFIATAHHANDNVETLLMNICKGSGIAGFHGIPPKNGNIIRPLLFATREEIDAYILENNVPYREDQSNQSNYYTRNKIRLQVIPLLKEIFPQLIPQVNESIERLRDAELLYQQTTQKILSKLIEKRGNDYYISVIKLKQQAALNSLSYEIAKMFQFSAAQAIELLHLLDSPSGKYIANTQYKLIKDRDFIIVSPQQEAISSFIPIEPKAQKIKTQEGILELEICKGAISIEPSKHIAYIDVSKLETPLILRRWRQADYFYPLGMSMKKKKLSKFFIDQKIALPLKERIWVLESNKKIVWVVAMRLDERFKITAKTKQYLKISFSQTDN